MAKTKKTEPVNNDEVLVLEAEEIPLEQKIDATITQELQKANLTETVIAALKERYMPLTINGQDDKEGYAAVREARLDCKRLRVFASKICKKGREAAIMEQRKWTATEADVTGKIEEIENYLEKQESDYDAEKDRIKLEKKQREEAQFITRSQALMKMGANFDGISFVLGDTSYDAILIRESDEDIYLSTILPKYTAIFEKNEEVRLENERIALEEKKKQEDAAALLLKQQQEFEEKQKQFAEQQRRHEEKRLELERQQADEERKKTDAALAAMRAQEDNRCSQLNGLGLTFDFSDNHYKGYGCFVALVDIKTENKEGWEKLINEITPVIERKKAEKQKEIEAQIEADKQKAIEKALEDQKEQQRLAQLKAEKDKADEDERKRLEMEKAGDKEKFLQTIEYLKNTPLHAMRSSQYRTKMQILREKLDEIKSL